MFKNSEDEIISMPASNLTGQNGTYWITLRPYSYDTSSPYYTVSSLSGSSEDIGGWDNLIDAIKKGQIIAVIEFTEAISGGDGQPGRPEQKVAVGTIGDPISGETTDSCVLTVIGTPAAANIFQYNLSKTSDGGTLAEKLIWTVNTGSTYIEAINRLHEERVGKQDPNSPSGTGEVFNSYLGSEAPNSALGAYSHAEGSETLAEGEASHAEGKCTSAMEYYSHAEGSYTIASGSSSHAEGMLTSAKGLHSHAEGQGTEAFGVSSHAEGQMTTANGNTSHAEGIHTIASGRGSHAEGYYTSAIGVFSHAEGCYSNAIGDYSHAEGTGCQAYDLGAHAEGISCVALGIGAHAEGAYTRTNRNTSHAEGSGTTASGYASHAEGCSTIAIGYYSHAEGGYTTADGSSSHAEGSGTTADGKFSHAEGLSTSAIGNASHVEGSRTIADGMYSHAEGINTIANGNASHAEGSSTTADGNYSHAEGDNTMASGLRSHAEGGDTFAIGGYSHAQNYYTTASAANETSIGRYNKTNRTKLYDITNIGLSMGNGSTNTSRGNAFEVLFNGTVKGDMSYTTPASDYAEMFEWSDGNPDGEDRVGYFVTLKGKKIKKATSTDKYIVGVVSSVPGVIGDNPMRWNKKYSNDEWGRPVYEEVEVPYEEPVENEDGSIGMTTVYRTEVHRKLNPEWKGEEPYKERTDRAEWAAVGLLGKLLVRQDGTLVEDSFCVVNDEGIATNSNDSGYFVMDVINDKQALILVK